MQAAVEQLHAAEDGTPSPAQAARVLAPGDRLAFVDGEPLDGVRPPPPCPPPLSQRPPGWLPPAMPSVRAMAARAEPQHTLTRRVGREVANHHDTMSGNVGEAQSVMIVHSLMCGAGGGAGEQLAYEEAVAHLSRRPLTLTFLRPRAGAVAVAEDVGAGASEPVRRARQRMRGPY
eukprot:COSAG01_NODE_2377_length_7801_cov_4.201117_14_plen_175_part_00